MIDSVDFSQALSKSPSGDGGGEGEGGILSDAQITESDALLGEVFEYLRNLQYRVTYHSMSNLERDLEEIWCTSIVMTAHSIKLTSNRGFCDTGLIRRVLLL